jgi:Protein of unknown function (DUF3108)
MAKFGMKTIVMASCCVLASAASAWAADSISISYVASASGAPVFKAGLNANIDGGTYSASFDGKTMGVTNMLSKYKIGLTVSGTVADGKLAPAKFTKATSKKKKDKFADLTFGSGGNFSLVTQDGPQTESAAVLGAAKGKAVDPLTAILRIAIAQGLEGAKPCSGTYRFYDGRDVGDLLFSLTQKIGTTYQCKMTLKSVAGRNVENHDDATVSYGLWLVPAAGSKGTLYLPARLTGAYSGLTVTVVATGITVNGAGVPLALAD